MGKRRWLGVMRLLVAPIVALALAGAAALTSFGLMGSLDAYNSALPYQTVDAAQPVPPRSLAPTRTARRVLLVVVDGLRADSSEAMPYLNELRQMGFSGQLIVSQPSYSKPGYAAIATGSTQELSGVVLNSHTGTTRADTIFHVAGRNGLTTAAIADSWWQELCGTAVTYPHYYPDATFDDPSTDSNTTAAATASLKTEAADLTLVHFAATDTKAHYSGGAASSEYTAAATRIDGFIREIAAQLDLSLDAIVVTADHGHLSRNLGHGSGHGGWEPEVLAVPLVAAGAGVNPGTLKAVAPAVDLTPTVSSLLGLPAPNESQGRILFPMLSAGGPQKAELALARAQQLAVLTPAYVSMLGVQRTGEAPDLKAVSAALIAGDYTNALKLAGDAIDADLAAMSSARQAAVGRARSGRLPLAIIELVALIAALYGAARLAGSGRGLLPLVGGATYMLLDWIFYRFLMHGTYSLGALTGSDIVSMLRLFAAPAYAAAAVVLVAALLATRPTERGERVAMVEAVLSGCVGAGFVVAIYGLWQIGTNFGPLLPDFHIAFVTLTYMLKGAFLAALFVLLPAVAAIWPVRRVDAEPAENVEPQ